MDSTEARQSLVDAGATRIAKIIVVGNSGRGKSFLCNALLGKEMFLHAWQSGSCTADNSVAPHLDDASQTGYLLYNIPGLIENDEENIKRNSACIEQAFREFPDDFTLVLYVMCMQVGGRLIGEDVEAYRAVKAFVPQLEDACTAVVVNMFEAHRAKRDAVVHESTEAITALLGPKRVVFADKVTDSAMDAAGNLDYTSVGMMTLQALLLDLVTMLTPAIVNPDSDKHVLLVREKLEAALVEKKILHVRNRLTANPPVLRQFSDSLGFNQVQRYRCIRCVSVDNVIYTVSRSETQLSCTSHNVERAYQETSTHVFAQPARYANWGQEQFFDTFSVCVLHEKDIFASFRSMTGLAVFVFDTKRRLWRALTECPAFSSFAGWAAQPQYASIRVVADPRRGSLIAIGHSVSCVDAFELCRIDADGEWNAATSVWKRIVSIADARRLTPHQLQIAVDTNVHHERDTPGRIVVLQRGLAGLDVSVVETCGSVSHLPPLLDRNVVSSATAGADRRGHFQLVAHDSNVYVTSRGSMGVNLFRLRLGGEGGQWERLGMCRDFGDDKQWQSAQHYSTVHLSMKSGHLVLSGRGKDGPRVHCFDVQAPERGWMCVPDVPQIFRDNQGFGEERFFDTYSVVHTKDFSFACCRANDGLHVAPIQLPI